MTESPRCARCGHEIGADQRCVDCGLAVGDTSWRTDTAERPPVLPPTVVASGVAPAAVGPPPRPRYPLFADEAARADAPVTVAVPSHAPPPSPLPPPPAWAPPPATSHRGRRGILPWVVATTAVVLLAVVGALLLFGGDDDAATATDPRPSGEPGSTVPTSTTPPATPEPSTPNQPSPPPAGPVKDLTRSASISTPVTAPPGTAVDGDRVTYNADNMLDGVPATAWRMPGDGAGREIRIDFGRAVALEEVGIVNGYAKRDPGYDGYTANRRITRVTWAFDDGSVQAQLLDEVRRMQLLDVGPVTTSTVTLRIVTVTPPGPGNRGRDYTAISDLRLSGRPA